MAKAVEKFTIDDVPVLAGATEFVNVKDYGAIGDGTMIDDSGAFTTAIAICSSEKKKLYIPGGDYRVNVSFPSQIVVEGEGSSSLTGTIIRPYSGTIAAFTYTAPYVGWDYHSIFRSIRFDKVGSGEIGFTIGKTNPSSYQTNDELIGRVEFQNCVFSNLYKGVQRPFGNIGMTFTNCEWESNYYGVFSLDAKYGGTMHAGCLYVIGGHSQGNNCAFYFHNVTDGFGSVVFENHISEQNFINVYAYNSPYVMFSPFEFTNMWNEVCGAIHPTVPANTVNISQWSGTTESTTNFPAKSCIFDGTAIAVNWNGGRFTGIRLKATKSIIKAGGLCSFEQSSSYGGDPCVIDSPSTSRIEVGDHVCDIGGITVNGMILLGNQYQRSNTANLTPSTGRGNIIPPRMHITTLNQTKTVVEFSGLIGAATGQAFTGTTSFTANVVSDGEIFSTCNEFTKTLTSSQYESPTSSITTMSVGYWVHTVAIKIISGAIHCNIWDRNTNNLADFTPIDDGNWHTYGGITYISSGTPTAYLDFSGVGSSATVRVSAFNLIKFDTFEKALEFIKSRVFVNNTRPAFNVGNVGSVVALKALTMDSDWDTQLVYLRGYYTDGDGGEGWFKVTTTNPGADNNGTIIHSTTSGYYFIRQFPSGTVRPEWFGAKGDGTTNDYTALAACISYARADGQTIVALRGGTHIIGTLPLDISGVSVHGSSAIGCKIKRSNTATGTYTVLLDGETEGGASRCTYQNFQIDGNCSGNATANWCIQLKGNVLNNTFTNIKIVNGKTGGMIHNMAVATRPSVNTFINLQILDCEGYGLVLDAGQFNTWIGLDIEQVGKEGIYIRGTDEAPGPLQFTNTWIEGTGDGTFDGVSIAGTADQVSFDYIRVSGTGNSAGTLGNCIRNTTGRRVRIKGPSLGHRAGASITGHRKIYIESTSGSTVIEDNNSLGAADIEDMTTVGRTVYGNDTTFSGIPLCLTNESGIAGNLTRYLNPGTGAVSATQTDVRALHLGRIGILGMVVEATTTPGGSDTYIVTLMQNGSASTLTVTLNNDNNGIASTTSGGVMLVNNDNWSIRVVTSATATAINANGLHITLFLAS